MNKKNKTQDSAKKKLGTLVQLIESVVRTEVAEFSHDEIAWILNSYSKRLTFDLEREFAAARLASHTKSSPLDDIIRSSQNNS